MVTTRGRSASTLVEQPQLPSPHKHQVNGGRHPAPAAKSTIHQATDSRLRKKRNNAANHASSTSASPEIKRRRTDSGSSSPVLNRSSLLEDPPTKSKHFDTNEATEENGSTHTVQEDVPTAVGATNGAEQELEARVESARDASIPGSTLLPEAQAEEEKPTTSEAAPDAEDIIAQAAKAAEAALLGYSQSETPSILATRDQSLNVSSTLPELSQSQIPSTTQSNADIIISTSTPQIQQTQRPPSQHRSLYNSNHMSSLDTAPPGQTQPTAVLYEAARRVANSKSTNNPRNPASSASQRRPWTMEEEHALMDGLDQVGGPRWSDILNLYGPRGTINETLKDRSQVQLKDKARNLKLFFLKSNIEVPYYLNFVTGELRTRTTTHGTTNADAASHSTTSAQSRQLNGSSPSTPVAGLPRTRFPPASIAQPTTATSIAPLLAFTSSNTVYSSPYAPIGNPLNGFSPNDNQEPSMDKNPSQQDVADLASSAAAQVAASLADFGVLDLPNLDLSASLDNKIDDMENDNMAQFSSMAPNYHANGNTTQDSTNTGSPGHIPPLHHDSTTETSALSGGIKTFDTH